MTTISASELVRFIRDGVIPYMRGEWDPTIADYSWAKEFRDIVTFNGLYYAIKTPGKTAPKGISPFDDVQQNKGYWEASKPYKMVVTDLLIAAYAILSGAVCVDGYMISQTGSLAGKPSTEYKKFKRGDSAGFQPDIVIDYQTGKIICNNAEIRGIIDASSGLIGDYRIQNGGLAWTGNNSVRGINFSPNWYTSDLPGPASSQYNVYLHLKMPLSNPYNRPLFIEGCAEFYGQTVVSGSFMTRGFQMNITDSTVNLTSSKYLFENSVLGLSNKNDLLVHCITPGLKLYLPKIATINALTDLTTGNSWTMRLTIIGKNTTTQNFYVEGGTDATIIDNNANATSYVNMAAGDVLELLLYHDKNTTTYRAQIINQRN